MSRVTNMPTSVAVLVMFLAAQWSAPLCAEVNVADSRNAIEAYLRQCHRVHVCNGSFLVAQHGEVVYQGAIGQATGDASRPLTSNTAFDIGSITKQFTAAGIIRLEERGRLQIDSPVKQYLPKFPYPQITIRQLLTQISGVPDVMPHYTALLLDGKVKAPVELDDVVQVLDTEKLPLISPPGARWAYSNTGYVLLGKIIESVSGKSYAHFLNDEFFVPLKMSRTQVRTPSDEPFNDRALGYIAFADGTVKPYDQVPNLYLYGAGGIYSTTSDLLRWAQALRHGKVMTAEHWQQATQPAVLPDGSSTAYGFGLSLKASARGQPRITHGGHWRGFKSELSVFPKTDTMVVLLTNNAEDESVEAARDAIEAILAGETPPVVAKPLTWQVADNADAYDDRAFRSWITSVAQGLDAENRVSEKEIINVGYALLARKQNEKAIAVFDLNRLAHPASKNALDSLADAYVANGEVGKARAQLELLIAMDPSAEAARKRLAELVR